MSRRCRVTWRQSATTWAVAAHLYDHPEQWAAVPNLPYLGAGWCDQHGPVDGPVDVAVTVTLVDALLHSRWEGNREYAAIACRRAEWDRLARLDGQGERWLAAHWSARLLARSVGVELEKIEWGNTL